MVGVLSGQPQSRSIPLTVSFSLITGKLVPPTTPTLESGLYWGYQVRIAESLACVFSESPFASEGGYDISIGTSERGVPIEEILPELPSFRLVLLTISFRRKLIDFTNCFRHLLLTLGPLSGLELTIAADPLIPLQAEDASDLFDYWINVVEGQGSRTVRTEVSYIQPILASLTDYWIIVAGSITYRIGSIEDYD